MMPLRYKWTPYLLYGRKLECKKNVALYHQGEQGKGFYYLDKGGVKVSLLSDNGHERIIDYVPAGTLIGEHGVYQSPYMTTAITTTAATVYHFSDDALANVCRDHPEAATLFAYAQIHKIRLLAEIIALLDSPIEQQMAHYLLKLVDIQETEQVTIDQSAFARYIGTSRITVNKILQKWRQQELIHVSTGVLHVLAPDKIKAILLEAERVEAEK